MIKSKKIGRVKISLEIINVFPDVAQMIMSVFIPLKAEIYPEGWIEYIGICDQFEEREEGFITPQYDFTVQYRENGKPFIKEITKLK